MLSTKLRLFPDHRGGAASSAGDEARGGRGLAPLAYLILKRASTSRPSGDWNDDDFDVDRHQARYDQRRGGHYGLQQCLLAWETSFAIASKASATSSAWAAQQAD